jgi:Protein of unknown function (DUF2635)
MDRLYVKPAEGRTLRDSDRDFEVVPPEGKYVPRNAYWLTRLRHEDAVEAPPPRKPKPEKPSALPKKED